ncbi:DUF1642 domain-containing protein [Lactococcus lactis]|uniref:DUF1642 domain-containing protein n=1 Tax=Lactococcus lactis TaxID=1358 RepID=UPI0032AFCB47
MTKFEEEVNKYNIFERTVYLEGGPKKILIDHFKNWHSDEEFQAEKDARKKEYEIHQDIYSKTSKKLNEAELEIANLKSQLQQQALPVVPECVAGAIESIPDHYSAFEAIDLIKSKVEVFTEENKDWLQVYNWLCEGIDNQDTFALAFITRKYQVEKPQLFYLKNKITKAFLYDNGLEFGECDKNCKDWEIFKTKFTQQEIDSMQTGSYELVPVEDGE